MWFDIPACMACEEVTMAKVFEYWKDCSNFNVGARLLPTPAASFMGDLETPLGDRALDLSDSGDNTDTNLHERTGAAKLVGLW